MVNNRRWFFDRIIRLNNNKSQSTFMCPASQTISNGADCVVMQQHAAKHHVHVDLSDLRKEYLSTTTNSIATNKYLDSACADNEIGNPIVKFKEWFSVAREKCKSYEEVNAVALSTVTSDNRPRCRIVLLKGFGDEGFQFFTNYDSAKGKELSVNPYAAMTVYWPTINHQVRIEGRVEKLPDAVSQAYWEKRPPKSQAGAVSSQQSRPLKNREELEAKMSEIIANYTDQSKPIPKPSCWGGYNLIPDKIEFWRGCEGRLHDRILYTRGVLEPLDDFSAKKGVDGWFYGRLQP